MIWEERLKIYDELISKCDGLKRKGKTVPCTTANGHMFSMLNKSGEIGLRFSKDVQKKYLEDWNTTLFKSYNSIMQGYVLVPDNMLEDLDALANYLKEAHSYVMSLDPK